MTPEEKTLRINQGRAIFRSCYREVVLTITGRSGDETAQDIVNLDVLDTMATQFIEPITADNALEQAAPRWMVNARQLERMAFEAALAARRETEAAPVAIAAQKAPEPAVDAPLASDAAAMADLEAGIAAIALEQAVIVSDAEMKALVSGDATIEQVINGRNQERSAP